MEDFREEEVLGKAYDSRLMRRLMGYARPFWLSIALAIVLLVGVTVAEVARPYVAKLAIDDHLAALDQPMRAYAPGEVPEGSRYQVRHGELVFVREPTLPPNAPPAPRYQLLVIEEEPYLVRGVIYESREATPAPDAYRVEPAAGGWRITVGDRAFLAERLTAEEFSAFRAPDRQGVLRLALLFFAVVLGGFLLNYGQTLLMQFTGQRIIYHIREELFSHLERMSLAFFDRHPVGRLVTRTTNDIETLNEMYTSVLINLFRDLFLLAWTLAIMLILDWRLTLVVLAVMPFMIWATVVYRDRARQAYRDVRVKLARINASLNENINGMRIVQIFRREGKQWEEFDAVNRDYLQAGLRQLRIFAIFRPSIDLLSSLALALLLWYGTGGVLRELVGIGTLVAFVDYTRQLFRPVNELSEKFDILQSAMASSERVFRLMDEEPEIQDPPDPKPLPRPRGKVEFDRVWFAYNPGEWVLRDVSFTIEPGETVALVGHTGAGKSSILSLLMRFYDVQKGEIRVDGVNVKEVRQAELRQRIAIVLQDVFLFSGDIKGNIRLHNERVDEERVREVARYVNADGFIRQLPGGYDEPVVERGATLSAGQRQLLAFARALAFDPAILVLDEATANIDTETELLIQDALTRLTRNRTTIIVAHRLSTIQHADKIIVLHKGKVREIGSHQELLARKGLYYNLYLLQYAENGNGGSDLGHPVTDETASGLD